MDNRHALHSLPDGFSRAAVGEQRRTQVGRVRRARARSSPPSSRCGQVCYLPLRTCRRAPLSLCTRPLSLSLSLVRLLTPLRSAAGLAPAPSAPSHRRLYSSLSPAAAAGSQRGVRPVSAPVFSQAALAEAGLPLFPLDQPQTSTPLRSVRQEERRLEVTMETVEPSKGEAGAEDKVTSTPTPHTRSRKCCTGWLPSGGPSGL